MISSSSFLVDSIGRCEGEYARNLRDVDGDIISICYGSGFCPYRKVVKDADGDKVELCNR